MEDLLKDLTETEARIERLRKTQVDSFLNNTFTRSRTTTSNARIGELCARRDELKRMIKSESLKA